MSFLDERLDAAVQDLRGELDQIEPPAFRPNRSSVPLALALVLLLGIGAVGYVVGTRADDNGGISVATQPAVPDSTPPALEVQPGVPTPVPNLPEEEPDEEEATALSGSRQISRAETGDFYVPIPGTPAWSRDERHVLLYRTGAATPGHVVVNVADGSEIEVPFTPPDIEQIYWHPTIDDQLLYAAGNELFTFDLNIQQATVLHRFDGCDSVDSGLLPVPPAADGTLSLLCYADGQATQVALNLGDLSELRIPTLSTSAAFPSPSGNQFVRWNLDGSASVLDRQLSDTGVVLDLQNNLFTFVTDSAGVEWIAASLFDGPAIGTLVLLRLDGTGEPVVIVGPERGDPYPPSGNQLSGTAGQVAVATSGPLDGPIAGRVTVFDLATSFTDPPRHSIRHGSVGLHGYWSTPFVSISPSGGQVLYSSEQGINTINTHLATIFIFDE